MDANTAFKGLIASQLEGLATLIAERFDGVDKQGVLTLVQAHCETLPDMDAAIKSKKPRRRDGDMMVLVRPFFRRRMLLYVQKNVI